ncbi:hypothetical protein FACS1894181_10150 [Bacteroidia bacterium]|nr:hypothetical protein FACS1894181_10150 [Bacteroidia bacterium]
MFISVQDINIHRLKHFQWEYGIPAYLANDHLARFPYEDLLGKGQADCLPYEQAMDYY